MPHKLKPTKSIKVLRFSSNRYLSSKSIRSPANSWMLPHIEFAVFGDFQILIIGWVAVSW
jgi:hypothetical protein